MAWDAYLKQEMDFHAVTSYARELAEKAGLDAWIIEGLSQTSDARLAIGLAEAVNKGFAEGRAKRVKNAVSEDLATGIEKGKLSVKLEMARKMKQKGLSDALILEMTGLTAEQIAGL